MKSRFALALFVWCLPQLALACPVCFDPNETSRGAFLSTAVFLSLLPLGMIAGSFWWLARRVRELGAAEQRPNG